ncbi:MAG: heme-binding protein [Lacunisphaera sp.]|nr:heme-binding protein [Lacunisphaera sp.]
MTKLLALWFCLAPILMAAAQAFPPSPAGTPEFKTLPAGMLLKSAAAGDYFAQSGRLFRPLFAYISKHDIAMTTPVEARMDGAAMFFWVAASERAKVAGSGEGVEVIEVPERHVASLGARGGYTESNFRRTRDELLVWLRTKPDVQPAGEPYAVFWNGPFLPGFLKHYEVHVPVRPAGA